MHWSPSPSLSRDLWLAPRQDAEAAQGSAGDRSIGQKPHLLGQQICIQVALGSAAEVKLPGRSAQQECGESAASVQAGQRNSNCPKHSLNTTKHLQYFTSIKKTVTKVRVCLGITLQLEL